MIEKLFIWNCTDKYKNMNSSSQLKAMVISFIIIVASFLNFIRVAGSAYISGSQVVTLLVCGIAIGIFITNLFSLLRNWKP